jgi:hypothetical protein
MKPLRVGSILTALVLLAPAFARADGMLQQLPADGAWVRFRVLTVIEDQDGVQTRSDGYVTMSSVGVVTEDNERCRWLELTWKLDEMEGEYFSVVKLLIPERHLQKGEIPLDHAKRIWAKQWDRGKEAELVTDHPNHGDLHWYLAGPLQESKKPAEVKKVEYQSGTLTCEDGVVGSTRWNSRNEKYDALCKMWFHEKAAFGVAAAEVQVTGKQDGKLVGTWHRTLILTDTGENAKTQMPEGH